MQPLSGNLRPDLLTSLMNMSLVLRLAGDMHLCRSSSNDRRLSTFLKLLQNPHILLTFGKVENPLRLPHKTTLQRPKMVRACGAFNIFYFQMSFAPQRRALVQHLNFQKCSEDDAFCTFWLGNVLRTTTACTFWTSQLRKVLREWCALYILTSTRASCQNGMHFSTSQLRKMFWVCSAFSILTSKCASRRHALFPHRNFDKRSEYAVFLTCWLRNVLHATTACNFHLSSPQMAPHPPL